MTRSDKGTARCPHRGQKVVSEEMTTVNVWLVTEYRRGPAGASPPVAEDLHPSGRWFVVCEDCHKTWTGKLAQVSKAPLWVRNAIYACENS